MKKYEDNDTFNYIDYADESPIDRLNRRKKLSHKELSTSGGGSVLVPLLAIMFIIWLIAKGVLAVYHFVLNIIPFVREAALITLAIVFFGFLSICSLIGQAFGFGGDK